MKNGGEQMKTTEILIRDARYALNTKWPYLSSILYYLKPQVTMQHGPTLSVAKSGQLYVHPEFFGTHSAKAREFFLLHECNHLLRCSHERSVPHTNKRVSNIAADLPINESCIGDYVAEIKESGGVLPDSFKLPANQSHEKYYRLLMERQEQEGEGEGEGSRCTHDVEPGEGDDFLEADLDEVRRATAQAIADAVKSAPGTVPDGLVRWANELLSETAKISWRRKLSHKLRETVRLAGRGNLRTWNKVPRSMMGLGMGVGSPRMPHTTRGKIKVDVWIDTSGSMSDSLIKEGMVELKGILSQGNVMATIMSIDAAKHTEQKVTNIRDVVLRGGGGTVFTDMCTEYKDGKRDAQVVIVFTDGEIGGLSSECPTNARWLWLVPPGAKVPVSWGETITLEDS